jgi:hypothetical protein
METYTFEKTTEKYTTLTHITKSCVYPRYNVCATSKQTTIKAKSLKDAEEMVSRGDCHWEEMGGKKSNYEKDY